MEPDDHFRCLGRLLANLHSLEFLIRLYLSKQPGARLIGPAGVDIYNSPVGTQVPESDMTSYDTLGKLVAKFNRSMEQQGKRTLDASLIALRDALAHGRVSAAGEDKHLRLIKFDRPENDCVRVAYNNEMTENWFLSNIELLREAIGLVYAEAQP